jgi:glycosyltransferase involved in cell wall biosynthesis
MVKIKILYALESAGGGTLKHVVYLATKLDKDKFDITIALPDENYEKDTHKAISVLKQNGIHIDIIPMVKKLTVRDIAMFIKIRKYLKKRKFDVVHAHSSKAGVLFRFAAWWISIPVIIYTPHCFHFTAHTGVKRWFYAEVERILAKITTCIVISGTEQVASHKERIKPEKGIVVIDNAIDPREYERIDMVKVRKIWNIPDHHKIVIGVGRLAPQKNWEEFLKVAKLVLEQNNENTFIIAGEGPCHNLSKLIGQLDISANVRLCGHLDNVSLIYSIADIFVSTSQWEGLPYTYLEAAHFNIPMLIAPTEGMEYFFENSDAIPAPKDNSGQFCHEILKLLSISARRKKGDQTSPFSIERFIENHEKLYMQLL